MRGLTLADTALVGADRLAKAFADIVAGSATWIDVAQMTGLSDGDPIDSLTDLSGNARHATAAGAARSTYKTNIFNGRPVARFNGTANTHAQAGYTAIPQPFTIIAVLQATAGSLLDRAPIGDDATNRVIVARATAQTYNLQAGSAVTSGSTGINNTRSIVTSVANGASSFQRANGAQGTTGDAGARVLRGFTIGSTYFATSFMAGDFAELIVHPSQLSTSDIRSAEAVLAAKYGIRLLG